MKPKVTQLTPKELEACIRRAEEELKRAPKEDLTWYLHRIAELERWLRETEP